jgi:molecular chaperone DnaK (HSP70)
VSRPVRGIDLGTTNSVVASIDDPCRLLILPNAPGSEIRPWVAFSEPGGAVVGEEALQAIAVVRITLAIDRRLTFIAHELVSGRELTLEAFVEGVMDSEESQRLTRMVGMIAVGG